MKKYLAIAALLSVPAFATAATNLVVNGSFESYPVANGDWTIYTTPNGWTTGPGGVEIRNNVAGTAADGVRYAELDANYNSEISQTINTGANQSLLLSFFYAPRAGVSTLSNPIDVLWNGTSIGTYSGDGTVNSNWYNVSLFLTGDGDGSNILKFRASGTSDSYGGSLDNISVTAVPEPETSAMLLAGLGLLAAVARRRKTRD